ncbi:class A beta-lactamase-related serine hydrolase [Paenibacillus sp. 1011MAR3C5]|uniref:serine hydrolase domain-containing protein n=1 Tax=Paenibacillus sp. 1011MAR3C5 TaxID=1675787 RepID=UPI000E6BC2EE|nr:serine hydrolase domain-containing protein [Paenibacillus sp. 1011MAR3C5]RJE85107.1 class A beta-lactamase-related serine hydrolase [Paenibacillus sp. 1011MAR3C5]
MSLANRIEALVQDFNDKAAMSFSGSIRVTANGEQFEKSCGYANRSEGIHNSANTRFGIASGCKIFTAVAIAQLVEQGKLGYDTLLKEVVEHPFPAFDSRVSVHHLLTHTSGVPDYFDEETMSHYEELWSAIPTYRVKSPSDFLPLFDKQEMKFAPGERFSYCNSGFILLGLIVEKVSGQSFTSYVEEHIFRSCRMDDSGYFAMDRLPERTALGYIGTDTDWRTNQFSIPITGGPDGGAYTTVRDLDRFWDALLNFRLLSEESTARMLHPHAASNEHTSYGYGVWMTIMDGKPFKYFVMGSDPGVVMLSSAYLQPGVYAHVLANVERGAGMIASGIDEFLLDAR